MVSTAMYYDGMGMAEEGAGTEVIPFKIGVIITVIWD
jgi:hypothetical protein